MKQSEKDKFAKIERWSVRVRELFEKGDEEDKNCMLSALVHAVGQVLVTTCTMGPPDTPIRILNMHYLATAAKSVSENLFASAGMAAKGAEKDGVILALRGPRPPKDAAGATPTDPPTGGAPSESATPEDTSGAGDEASMDPLERLAHHVARHLREDGAEVIVMPMSALLGEEG